MRTDTRLKFNAYTAHIAEINGVPSATEKFTVAPSVQQKLESRIQESADFLKRINIVPVIEQEGSKLGLGVGNPIASTTNTDVQDRVPVEVHELDEQLYKCTQTNFDTYIKYATLDMWAKFPDFQKRLRDAIIKRQALDRILIGFNGVARAATSNRVANPLLQDVNIGWLQRYRTAANARVLDSGSTANQVRVGSAAGADYANLDALVVDAVAGLIEPWHQEDTDLVAIVSRDLLHDKYFPLINQNNAPTEQQALSTLVSQKRLGGLQAMRVPGMKANAIFITRLDNLSIYWQEGTRRRTIVDNAKRDRIENYESTNECYVVEDFGAGCLIENITQAW